MTIPSHSDQTAATAASQLSSLTRIAVTPRISFSGTLAGSSRFLVSSRLKWSWSKKPIPRPTQRSCKVNISNKWLRNECRCMDGDSWGILGTSSQEHHCQTPASGNRSLLCESQRVPAVKIQGRPRRGPLTRERNVARTPCSERGKRARGPRMGPQSPNLLWQLICHRGDRALEIIERGVQGNCLWLQKESFM